MQVIGGGGLLAAQPPGRGYIYCTDKDVHIHRKERTGREYDMII